MELPTKEQVDTYLKGASSCLFCASGNIEGTSVEVDSRSAFQKVHCTECGREWTDLYELSAVAVVPKNRNSWYSDEAEIVYEHEQEIVEK
jgi:hypothetical protein